MRTRLLVLLAALPLLAHAEPLRQNDPPAGFVDLARAVPTLRLDLRYATAANFTGAPLPGYGLPGAWLRAEAAEALARVQEELKARGWGLLVYDAYRPERATKAMVAWALRSGRRDVLDGGYVARKSGHNHGHTIDLTAVDLATGALVDMGSPWDLFDAKSHTDNASGRALEHRHALRDAMVRAGFVPYAKEWWHFGFPLKGTKPLDVPYSCAEPPRGRWRPPAGWDRPGWLPAKAAPPTSCWSAR